MSEKPVFEAAVFSDFIAKVCQCIPSVHSSADNRMDAAGPAVRNDVVHIPAYFAQRFSCRLLFILAGSPPFHQDGG